MAQKANRSGLLWFLESNRSGLWHHIIETSGRLGWLCRKHSCNVERLGETQHFCCPTKIFCRTTWVLCSWEWHCAVTFINLETAIHAFSVWLLVQCYDIRAAFIPYMIKHSFYKQPDLYYFEAIKMTSQAKWTFTENVHLRLVFSIQNLTKKRLTRSLLWLQNSIDRAVS